MEHTHHDETLEPEKKEHESTEAGTGIRLNLAPLTTPRAIIWNGLMISVSILVAAFIVSGATFSSDQADLADDTAAPVVIAADIKKVSFDANDPYVGSASAPVTLVYWSDYQCPFCKQFQDNAFKSLMKEYVETGKVKIVFKDFAFLGQDSLVAALYGRAVWSLYPDQYPAWHEAIYKAQDAENGGFGDEASVKKLTASIPGIDAEAISKVIASHAQEYQELIDADREEATQFGIKGTPSFITGKKLIPGVASFEAFKSVIDPQLK